MGIGIVFYGVAEPIMHFAQPPDAVPRSAQAARDAMGITFFHWGVHAWAIYAVLGLALAYFGYRRNQQLAIRSAFHPILGDRIQGPLGDFIDIFAVVGRSEEHTSELQSLMRISYAVSCLTNKKQ